MEIMFSNKPEAITIKGVFEGVKKTEQFSGKKDEFLLENNTLFAGLGKKELFNNEQARICAANACKYLRNNNYKNFCIVCFEDKVKQVTEGVMLGLYHFIDYKTKNLDEIKKVEKVIIVGSEQKKNEFEKARTICTIVNQIRDFQNLPANIANPEYMAEQAKQIAKKHNLKITVWDKKELEKKGYNGILCVGKGSSNNPLLVMLEYNPKGRKKICLVGKGVTFDSGGLDIKPADYMADMKFDMSGAAAVFGCISALAELKIDAHIIGITPFVENMPDGNAYRPGDIITMGNKQTVEIVNTDAEGRMILADALHHATTLKPDYIVDFATLTGACIVALGPYYAGIMGTDPELISQLIEAGKSSGEKLWELPLTEEYLEDLKSEVADIKHCGNRYGGAITAARFLKEFLGDKKWAHIDIAGTANVDKEKPYKPFGGTGFGVRLVVEWLSEAK